MQQHEGYAIEGRLVITVQTGAGQTVRVNEDGFVRGPDKARSKLFRLDPQRWGVLYLLSKWPGSEVELHLGDLIELWGEFCEGVERRETVDGERQWIIPLDQT